LKRGLADSVLAWTSKRLSAVDLPGEASHQHEIGVPNSARRVFEPENIGPVFVSLLLLSKQNIEKESTEIFYYNVRQNKPRSAEYRVYYSKEVEPKLATFSRGDYCVFLKDINHKVQIILAQRESRYARELQVHSHSHQNHTSFFFSIS